MMTLQSRELLKASVREILDHHERDYPGTRREAALLVISVAEMIVSDCDRQVAAERRRGK